MTRAEPAGAPEPRPNRPGTSPPPPLAVMRAALVAAFAESGAGAALLDAYARFAFLLLEENRRTNLTAIQDPSEVAAKHFLDSYLAGAFLEIRGKRVLDLGSGGGFPGIPLALATPGAEFVLLDATRKKAEFLGRAIATLGLGNARAAWGRGEEILRRERFDLVLVRAGGRLVEVLRLLHPVRRGFGRLALWKGPRLEEEKAEAARAGLLRAFPVLAERAYALPGGAGERRLLVLRGGAAR